MALIDKHYILNEEVKGINSFALEHYNEIKKAYPNKPDEWILSVYKQNGKYYKIDKSRAHIKSYELVKLISSDKIRFSFEELQKLPTALYDISNSDIKDISAFDDSNFIEYRCKEDDLIIPSWLFKQEPKLIYYYADCECYVVSYEYYKAYCISYKQRNDKDMHFIW